MAELPKIVHVQSQNLAIVFDLTLDAMPRIAYWGKALKHSDNADIAALVQVSHKSMASNEPENYPTWGIVPLESDWWPGRPGLLGFRGQGRGWTPRFVLSNVTFGGKQVPYGDVATVGLGRLEFHLTSTDRSLGLIITVDVFPQGLFRIQCHLTNLAESAYYLQELGVALPLSLEANEILDTCGRWGKERVPQRRLVHIGCDLREGRHGRTGFDAPGFTFVGPQGFGYEHGEIWGLHTAWSGNHRTWVEKMLSGAQVIGGSEILEPGEVTLHQGETYQTPWFYACHGDGLDNAAVQVHRWMRARPEHPSKPRLVTLNVWEAVYFKHDLDTLKRLAKIAAGIGVERFVLDDGWFKGRRNDDQGLGDWFVDPDVWPHGLTPLVDDVHELGMEFGLWFEPEMVSENSDVARAHPDWILAAQGHVDPENLPKRWRHQQGLNLTISDAFDYVFTRMDALISEYDIAYIKWDHNRDLIEAGSTPEGGVSVVSAQTKAVYRLLDQLKAAHPGLEIESCSSGGGRVDLEILQHTDRFWASDCIDPVERVPMMNWYSQVAPPELLGAHVASPISHTTGRTSPLSMRAGTAIWGSFGIEWNLLDASQADLAELAAWITFYKENRAFLHSGNQVRCTTPDPTLYLHGVVAPDGSRALYQLVTHDRSPIAPRGRLRFRGLNPDAHYRLRPVIIGQAPSGLIGPPWFGQDLSAVQPGDEPGEKTGNNHSLPGISMSGEGLAASGVEVPRMHPDQSLLFEATIDKQR